ncbi:MAG: hypothetical protein K6A28_01695 [Bacteroidales bacterium]|nr:hypothetical protein [Bacteroidales bacterium]
MCFKKIHILSLLCACVLLSSCKEKTTDGTAPTRWGKEDYYESFLWKKHAPDTLYRTIEFEFNDDAKNFMDKPLRLGLYKRTDSGKMLPVKESEMEVFVDGRKCPDNIVDVAPGTEQLEVGIVFNPEAENKVHHWFFRAVDDGGLERINDLAPDAFNADNASLLDVDVEKHKVMNPLAEVLILIGIVIGIALLLWFLMFKFVLFPRFRVGKMQLTDPVPYNSLLRLRKYRKLVLTNKAKKQGFFSRLFTGRILYEVNSIWTNDVVVEPKDSNSVRLRCPKDYMADGRVLRKQQEYTIQNITTGTKTKIKIS